MPYYNMYGYAYARIKIANIKTTINGNSFSLSNKLDAIFIDLH
jgi:hypothetical protein